MAEPLETRQIEALPLVANVTPDMLIALQPVGGNTFRAPLSALGIDPGAIFDDGLWLPGDPFIDDGVWA
jgi:hypothetical protein